jgi:hypothetical protein
MFIDARKRMKYTESPARQSFSRRLTNSFRTLYLSSERGFPLFLLLKREFSFSYSVFWEVYMGLRKTESADSDPYGSSKNNAAGRLYQSLCLRRPPAPVLP